MPYGFRERTMHLANNYTHKMCLFSFLYCFKINEQDWKTKKDIYMYKVTVLKCHMRSHIQTNYDDFCNIINIGMLAKLSCRFFSYDFVEHALATKSRYA